MIVAEQAKECTAALRCSARRGRLVDGQDIPPFTEKVCGGQMALIAPKSPSDYNLISSSLSADFAGHLMSAFSRNQ